MTEESAKAVETELFTSSLDSMRLSLQSFEKVSQRLKAGDVAPETIVSQLDVKLLIKANAAAMRAADEMIGSLFDEKA